MVPEAADRRQGPWEWKRERGGPRRACVRREERKFVQARDRLSFPSVMTHHEYMRSGGINEMCSVMRIQGADLRVLTYNREGSMERLPPQGASSNVQRNA